MADFAHHTDDLHVAAVVEYEVRTERVQAAEVLADQRRVGDGHLPSPRVVSGIEVAPREQGNPERCDPARRRPARLRRGSLGGGQGRPADDGEVGSHIEARQRQHLADSGALGTWKRFEAGQEALREALYVGRARVSLPRQRDARREDALGTEARLGTLQADEAATEKCCHGQQQSGEGDLDEHRCSPCTRGGVRPDPFGESLAGVAPTCLKRGRKRCGQRHRHGDQERAGSHPGIDSSMRSARQVARP